MFNINQCNVISKLLLRFNNQQEQLNGVTLTAITFKSLFKTNAKSLSNVCTYLITKISIIKMLIGYFNANTAQMHKSLPT